MPRRSAVTIARISFALVLAGALALSSPLAVAQGSRPATQPTNVLEQTLPEVQFQEQPFADVLDWLSKFLETTISVEWKELGIEKDAPISIRVRNVSVRTLLTLVLVEAGKGERECDFKLQRDGILISSARRLAGPMSARDYDLNPLLQQFESRGFKVQPDEIAAAVQGATSRGRWGKEPGAGSLVVDGNRLRVSQTERGHEEIRQLLARLEKPHEPDTPEQRQNDRTVEAFKQPTPQMRFQGEPFDQVIEYLGDYARLNFNPDWQRIEDAGIKKDAPVELSTHDQPLHEVLQSILASAAGKKPRLAYDIIGGVVWISTAEDIARGFTVRVHNVSVLVDKAKGNDAELSRFIQEHALKDSWRGAGGSAALWLIGDRLVVVQSCRGHHLVEEVLKDYRATQRRP